MAVIKTVKRSRRKRASVQDLYQSCKLGGDCPDDVKNKVEGKTLADKLLQIFSSIIFLGNLGIGTGRGTGGGTGYRPLGGYSGPKATSEVTVPRPAVPVDPLGGVEVIPLDVIQPTDSAIVPLTEGGLAETPFTDITDIGPAEIDVTVDNRIPQSPDYPIVSIHSTDIQTGPPPPPSYTVDVGTGLDTTIQLHIDAVNNASNIFVDPLLTGDTVTWGEEIELSPIGISEFEIEEATEPVTSTPINRLLSGARRISNRARDLYNRFTEQVAVSNTAFLDRPSRLVQFEIDNPAFSDDLSQIFEADVAIAAAAPEADFQDIQYLGRLQLGEAPTGAVRASRLGQRASLQTRSGLIIGRRVHFFQDISSIPEVSIELRPVGQTSADSTIIEPIAESTLVENIDLNTIYEDYELEDRLEEDFSNTHIILQEEYLGENIEIPNIPFKPTILSNITVPNSVTVLYPNATHETVNVTIDQPFYSILNSNVFGETYYLHPSLYKKRKKRSFFF